MIRTLYWYISRELVKVTLLSLSAFTLIMTVFAIIEPLRRQGLEAAQSLALITYTLPMMMSMTLPVAALFASTMVYGRFSQDNELLACRSSGISTITMLKPALALGGAATIVSILLSGFVTPPLLKMAETSIKANVRSIVYRRLSQRTYVDWGRLMVHADSVDEENNVLEGVVAIHKRRRNDIQVVVASKAMVDFREVDGDTWLVAHLINPSLVQTGGGDIVTEAYEALPPYKLPNLAQEDPSWYSWQKLVKTLKDPSKNAKIEKVLGDIQRLLCHDMLSQSVVSTIEAGGSFDEFARKDLRYTVKAGAASMSDKGVVKLAAASVNGRAQPVEVTVFRDGRPYRVFSAPSGEIRTNLLPISEMSYATIRLTGGVTVMLLSDERSETQYRSEWEIGELPIPAKYQSASKGFTLETICKEPERFTANKGIQKKIVYLRDKEIQELMMAIKAEMHMRAAYGLSCFLMVAMGAALGLILRGGQIVSAFAITSVPTSLVIVMMLMGKEMVRSYDPVAGGDASATGGLAVIWAGVLILLAANAVVYFLLSRK